MPVDFFNPTVIHNLVIIGNTNLQNDVIKFLKNVPPECFKETVNYSDA